MESHRIFICIAMLVACAFAVESAAIAENPVPVRQEVPEVSNVEPQAQQPEGHQRNKKWAVPLIGSYGYSAIPYTSYYPSAYSALPYYPAYRSYPYYSPYVF